MKRAILKHQAWIEYTVEAGNYQDWAEVIDEHLRQLHFLQHERLVHLIVTMAVMLLLGLVGIVCVFHPLFLVIETILIILELFYLRHYYFLENTTQYWYQLYNQLIEKRINK